jgi:hypothetical protein
LESRSRKALPLAAEAHPGLRAVEKNLHGRFDPTRVVERAGHDKHDVRERHIGIGRCHGDHASTRTTQLYDSRRDEVSRDEVERIVI